MLNHYHDKYRSSQGIEKERILQEFKLKMNMIHHYRDEIDLENYHTIDNFLRDFKKKEYPHMIVCSKENKYHFILGV